MKIRYIQSLIIVFILALLVSCAPTPEPTPTVDKAATRAVELAMMMQTQTAAAIPPTQPPTNTPAPTPTETLSPTPAEIKEPKVINGPASCYLKPDKTAVLSSNISDGKIVQLLAVGSLDGWYKIENPYFYTPCWIYVDNIQIDPNMDLSAFPVE